MQSTESARRVTMAGGRCVVAAAIGIVMATTVVAPVAAARQTITVGTAGVMGAYHPLGGALCRMVNVTRKVHGLRCSVERSEGSVANIEQVLAGDVDLGIAQGDTQHFARIGEGPFAGRPQAKLRALFSVYPEVFTLMARREAGVASFGDIRGKRVAVGTRGSGTRATMELVMGAFGVQRAELGSAIELRFMELAPALCDGRIDAFVFVAGHPNTVFQDAAASCATQIVGVAGPPLDTLLAGRPYFARAAIPGALYRGNELPQPSFGTQASIVVSADMPDATAYAITRAVFENFDDFRKLHPMLARLTRADAITGAGVPLHPGAVKYFREAGLM